ncbi:MAG: oxaloacetate decarboxylase [Gemmiger formicilis]|nr:oxaloacetate decarboxylase [Gemmiger formicilis]
MSFALLPVTLSMLCAGMVGIFLVLGVLVLGVYALNKFFSGK